MWNAIFLLCLFLIKIQNFYFLVVIIYCKLETATKIIPEFKIACNEPEPVVYKMLNRELFESKTSCDKHLVLTFLRELLGASTKKYKILTTPGLHGFLFSLVETIPQYCLRNPIFFLLSIPLSHESSCPCLHFQWVSFARIARFCHAVALAVPVSDAPLKTLQLLLVFRHPRNSMRSLRP